jgi:hypothetical protein
MRPYLTDLLNRFRQVELQELAADAINSSDGS